MDDENKTNGNETHAQRTPRARSRTVLLTSDMAGQVRSRLSNGGRETSPAREEPSTGLERHGEVTVTTQRPNFQPRHPIAEPQTPEVEEEIPSHITRQHIAEEEAAPAAEWQRRNEVVEQPVPEPYAMPERHITEHYSRPEHSITEQSYEPRVAARVETESRHAAPQIAEYSDDVNSGEDRIVWAKDGALVGFLISYDKNENGTVFELRAGRLIVTSEFAGTGNFLYLNNQTVSPMHAILRCSKGAPVQVLDQLSECGTKIVSKGDNETKELAGDKGTLKHGDTVFFGERSFKVCLIDE